MPPTIDELNSYREFTNAYVGDLKSIEFDPESVLWHYTNGSGLIGILESGELFATQVACLNDSTETLYAIRLYRNAMIDLQLKEVKKPEVVEFISSVLKATEEDPVAPSHSPSKFFVTCFSSVADDLSQWRAYAELGGENGYAIGFRARGLFVGPNSAVVKVNYDRELHQRLAERAAEATVAFYLEGLTKNGREADPVKWGQEFFEAWDQQIYRVAALVKDKGFQAENEYRIVHELQETEIHLVRFRQKRSLLGRHMSLQFPVWMGTRKPMLPIASVMVGPCREKNISAVSARTLLRQMGYQNVPVEISQLPLQTP